MLFYPKADACSFCILMRNVCLSQSSLLPGRDAVSAEGRRTLRTGETHWEVHGPDNVAAELWAAGEEAWSRGDLAVPWEGQAICCVPQQSAWAQFQLPTPDPGRQRCRLE